MFCKKHLVVFEDPDRVMEAVEPFLQEGVPAWLEQKFKVKFAAPKSKAKAHPKKKETQEEQDGTAVVSSMVTLPLSKKRKFVSLSEGSGEDDDIRAQDHNDGSKVMNYSSFSCEETCSIWSRR